jgi:DNA-binding MarR family transcriptional regulator
MQDKRATKRATSARAPIEPTALSIPHAITKIFREQNRLHGRAVQSFGLSTEQAHLLMVLWNYGPMSMSELGREVALSSGTLSTAVDRMEAAGLVRRIADEADRRSVRVEATKWPEGRRAKLGEVLLTTASEMLAPLSASEQAVLLGLLTRVLEGMPTGARKRGR